MTTPDWLGDWTPVAETRTTEVAAHPVAGLAAVLDADRDDVAGGQTLPPLWHWVALSEWPATAEIGPDGHPGTGGFLPTTPYPRRMWIGCTVDLVAPATIGAPVITERMVESVEEKSGGQGDFALVTVRTTVSTPTGDPLIVERTRLAYRTLATPQQSVEIPTAPAVGASRGLRRVAAWDWQLKPDEPLLMMFSALTANAHRIHYDAPYARDIEGYPGLLVHGPLMAAVMAEVVRRELPDRHVTAVTCRAMRPLYLGTAATIRGSVDGDECLLELVTGDDTVHMTASLTLG